MTSKITALYDEVTAIIDPIKAEKSKLQAQKSEIQSKMAELDMHSTDIEELKTLGSLSSSLVTINQALANNLDMGKRLVKNFDLRNKLKRADSMMRAPQNYIGVPEADEASEIVKEFVSKIQELEQKVKAELREKSNDNSRVVNEIKRIAVEFQPPEDGMWDGLKSTYVPDLPLAFGTRGIIRDIMEKLDVRGEIY
ncbi:hypothetical protein AALA52_08545 [Lactococcus ileimucosae]|uniref:Uncharacterized protein n=1 Tax=Lactococcus ileimucosae TaxID=2941329 RepID=A0ABV4D7K7_9LACT